MLIDCTECEIRGAGCSDCVVTLVLDHRPPLWVSDEVERHAVEALVAGGVVAPVSVLVDDRAAAASRRSRDAGHSSSPAPESVSATSLVASRKIRRAG